jgi:hypothetical protein
MLAPVYRSLEARSTVLGLAFPAEFSIVLCAWWAGMLLLGAFPGLALALGTYVLVRALNYGRAEGFVQHWLQWKLRRSLYAARLSAGARVAHSRTRRFPFGKCGFAGAHEAHQLLELLPGRRGSHP